jgi:hypothetical protein
MILKIITVALLATFEIYVAIGTGLGFGLSPHIICLATLTGGIAGVFAIAFLGDKIKLFLSRFKKEKAIKPPTFKDKILLKLREKYGIFGIGFIGSFIMGAPISIGIGVGLGIPSKALVKWSLIAVIIRCVAFSYFFNYLKTLF